MYATVTVLSVRTSTCLSCSSVLKRRRASHTASNSRQLICHCSWGPVQSPAAACPLHMPPQPVVEASVDTTTCLDTCARGTPAQRKARSEHGLKVWWQDGVTETRYVPWHHAHLMTRSWSQRWSGLIWSNLSDVTAAVDAICPRSLWKCFSGTALLHCSIDWARSIERCVVRLTESNSMPRKEILCVGESLLFSQLIWIPNRLRWLSTVSLCSHNSARDWASMSQSSRKLRTRMPASLSGTRAASTTLVKTRGDRDSPKGRALYWYARPSNAKRRNGLCRGRIETWK